MTRPVLFDGELLREAYAIAGSALVDIAGAVPEIAWDQPGLGDWTVRDLLGHSTRSFVTVTEYLESGAGKSVELDHPFDYGAIFAMAHADPAAVTERGRAAGRELGEQPVAEVALRREAAVSAVADHPDDAPVATPVGVMRLVDYLPSRIFELVVHGNDLARAIELDHVADVGARTVATVFAAGLAAEGQEDLLVLRALTGRAGLEPGFTVL